MLSVTIFYKVQFWQALTRLKICLKCNPPLAFLSILRPAAYLKKDFKLTPYSKAYNLTFNGIKQDILNRCHNQDFLFCCVKHQYKFFFHVSNSFKQSFENLYYEWAKFRGSRAIVGLVGFVPSCHRAFVGLWFFVVGILWVQSLFSWVFPGSETFFREYFVSPNFFSWVFLWIQNFFSCMFRRYLENI